MTALLASLLVFVALAPVEPGPRGSSSAAWRRNRLGRIAARVGWGLRIAGRLRRRGTEDRSSIPASLELMARGLRAGGSVMTALELVSTEVPEAGLDRVTHRVRGGLSLADAIDDWALAGNDRQMMAALLVVGYQSGAAMAASLDRAAATIRRRHELGDEVRALTAQTRASGLVVSLAPVGFACFVVAIDRAALQVFVSTPLGWLSLTVGLALCGIGTWWMARLTRTVAAWA